MTRALVDRSHYPCLAEIAYLNQASLGLISEPALQSMHRFLDDIARHGNLRMTDAEEVAFFESLRASASQLLRCESTRLAIVASASEVLGQLPLMLRPVVGDNIVLVSTDFPAITRPWIQYAAKHNCSIRFVDDDASANLTDVVVDRINERTAAVCVSFVQYATGSVVDVPRLRSATSDVGAHLVVDVTQAAGAIPIDAEAWDADAVVTSGYKWLGGHGGVGLAAMSPSLLSKPPVLPGWMGAPDPFAFDATRSLYAEDARRYTQSTMAYVSMAGLTTSVNQLLALDVSAELHAQRLAAMLVARAAPLGWTPFRNIEDQSASAHIVALAKRGCADRTIVDGLRQRNVVCAARNGRVRISIAPYNNSDDIDALVDQLSQIEC